MILCLCFPALVIGVMKRGIARCLGVMVAMGWGVIRDSLGPALYKIILLGLLYCGLSAARDVFASVAVHSVQTISVTSESELINMILILTPMVIFVNFVFYFWMMNSMKATTQYLENMNQTSKLKRHLRLRTIILISLGIACAWLIFNCVEVFANVLDQENQWILEATMNFNYLFVLCSVAILWRPNPNAKEYALQLEIPALGGEGDDENELELSCVVPSAAGDEDGNDPDHSNGIAATDGTYS